MLIDARPPELPAPDALARELSARLDGFENIAWTANTGSTNADLLAQARHCSGPMLLGAHQQDAGRGRAGRPWQNRAGATLMFSCAFPVQLPTVQLPSLSPLAGLAAGEALRGLVTVADDRSDRIEPNALRVKWPNDLQWHDAKLAGILVESTRNLVRPETYTIVIGMGLNLKDGDRLSQSLGRSVADWTTIMQQTGSFAVSVADIVCASANAWRQAVQELATDGFDAFRPRFSAIDALAGREVNVIDQGAVLFSGTAQGLDEHGRLLVQAPQGLVSVSVGEISIRPRTTEQAP
ncbi:biotin--[acetyl-CoA-carboxylase] ligase [Bordetella sp. 15P40C-2]|uniref:biotin--[acetyl-CoA-carboxylase] ligase n=1 Tax=Bordetella sp. 15P40C-2 TaxID=2572246 RepID=UPI0013264D0E|nr:biotin--[acetyl-CoA-carboxylase] ligase [Bordetella sp. 15P40C-2]MVW71382.1 biotin--[acetyl-CoA-carboxylase] ligase [Bordetella sp. 15P40C-2]